MRTVVIILTIAICALLITAPVSAAADGAGKDPAGVGPAEIGQDQGAAVGKIAGEINDTVMQVRETLQEQIRIQDRTGNQSEAAVLNRTQEREQAQIMVIATMTQARNVAQERQKIREERAALNATLGTAASVRAGGAAMENEVRLAVHTLLAMENITGGIGPQVSSVATAFNNSAWQSWQLEERIRNRDAFSRFFFGGDQVSAAELASLTAQNQDRIRQITQIMANESLDDETRAMLQEQLAIMEQENTRLGQLSSTELQDRGIFGWIGK
jgi:predicted small secreted protein